MNRIQMEKVRKIMRKVKAMPEEHEVGGWVEEDHIYLLVKQPSITEDVRRACLFSIDLDGAVQVYRNYAPLQLRNDSLIMGLR